MSDFNLTTVTVFPQGTAVSAFQVSNWPNNTVDTSAAPVGAATNTQTMGATGLTFTGLTDLAKYVAHAQVGGVHRYVFFQGAVAPDQTAVKNADNAFTTKQTFAGEIQVGGALNHDGTDVGFYGVAPVVRPAAYTQTYATASRIHANLTSADVGVFTGGTVGFLDAAERDNLRTQINALRADLANVKQVLNASLDDDQSQGLKQ